MHTSRRACFVLGLCSALAAPAVSGAQEQDIAALLRGSAIDNAPASNLASSAPDGLGDAPVQEQDPFAPPGVKIGTFILRGSLDTSVGHDSNPLRVPNGRGSVFTRLGGESELRSNWSRHALEAQVSGSYTRYSSIDEADAPRLDALLRGRVDAREDIEIDALAGIQLDTLEPGDPDTPNGLRDRPLVTELRGVAGVTYKPGPWSFRAGGRVERDLYENGRFISGAVLDTGDRINTTYALDLRGGYTLSPRLDTFIEASIDRRVYDDTFDQNGLQRDSTGYSLASGLRYDMSALVQAEIRTGYRWRRYEDASLPDLSGITADASIVWSPTALTTVRLTAGTLFDDTTLVGSSGSVTHFVRGEITHALRRNIAITAALQAERADYSGISRTDDEFSGELGLEWRFNRRMGIRASAEHMRLTSDASGADYTATLYQVGLRFRY